MRLMQYAGAEVPGGLLRHVEILTCGLAAAGHEIHAVLSPAAGVDEVAAACAAAGAKVTRATVRSKTDVGGLVRLAALVASERPEILHLHLSSPVEAIPAILAARCGGAKHLVTTEHAPSWFPLEKSYSRAAKRTSGRCVGAVIALSRADASFLAQRFDVPADRITVIPNGVPVPAGAGTPRDEARQRLGLPVRGWPIVGYVGALEANKGLFDLIEAAERLAAAGHGGLILALAGEGSLEPELRSAAASLPFDLRLCGRVKEVGVFLAAIDLFALPSHQESMPLALLEAMSVGLAIVATRVGGIPEAIEEGVSGLLVEPRRPDALAIELGRLAGDEALRRAIGGAALASARARFDAASMVRAIETVYRGLLLKTAVAPGRSTG